MDVGVDVARLTVIYGDGGLGGVRSYTSDVLALFQHAVMYFCTFKNSGFLMVLPPHQCLLDLCVFVPEFPFTVSPFT